MANAVECACGSFGIESSLSARAVAVNADVLPAEYFMKKSIGTSIACGSIALLMLMVFRSNADATVVVRQLGKEEDGWTEYELDVSLGRFSTVEVETFLNGRRKSSASADSSTRFVVALLTGKRPRFSDGLNPQILRTLSDGDSISIGPAGHRRVLHECYDTGQYWEYSITFRD